MPALAGLLAFLVLAGAPAGGEARPPVPAAAPEGDPPGDAEPPPRPPEPDIRREFDRRYAAWKAYLERPEVRVRSDVSPRLNHDTFRMLADLGPRAVPFALERLPENRFLAFALERMTRRQLSAEERARASTPDGAVEAWRSWWAEGRKEGGRRFAEAYRDWRRALASGERLLESEETRLDPDAGARTQARSVSALGQAAARVRSVGVDALPWLASRIRAGDRTLLPLFSDLTGGLGATDVGAPEERARFTLEWWEANAPRWSLSDAPPDPGDIPMDSAAAAHPAPPGEPGPPPGDRAGGPFKGVLRVVLLAGLAGGAFAALAWMALERLFGRRGRRP